MPKENPARFKSVFASTAATAISVANVESPSVCCAKRVAALIGVLNVKNDWVVLLKLLFLGWLDNSRSPFFPDIIQSLQLTAIQGSLFFAVTSLVSFGTGFFNDRLLKRVTSLQMLQVSSVVMGLGFFLIAQSSGVLTLLLAAALFGLGYGSLTFVQNVIVQEWAPAAMRRRIFIGLHSMYGLAALLAPLSGSAFITFGWSWRKAFMLLGLLPVLLGYLSQKIFRNPPRSSMRRGGSRFDK